MNKAKQTQRGRNVAACIAMLLALVWLTVCLPFVHAGYQQLKQLTEQSMGDVQEDTSNPFGNTNEEKTESGAPSLSLYMHELHNSFCQGEVIVRYYKCQPSNIYYAFHPDLFSPPPEA